VGNQYRRGGKAVGLTREDGEDELIVVDDEKKEKPTETETQIETVSSDSVEGKPKEQVTTYTSEDTKLSFNNKKDDGDELIKGLQNEPEINDIKSAQSREKGDTIDSKNLENEKEKEQNQEGQKIVSDLKIKAEKFFGNIAQQQTEELNLETEQKKDNSSKASGVISSIREITKEPVEVDKKITPTPRNRTIVSRNFKKKRNKVIIIEKQIAANPSMSVGGGSGGSSGLNNLGEFNFDNEKKITKKFQSVILNT